MDSSLVRLTPLVALATLSCTDSDPQAQLQVVSVAYDGAATLTLTFSQPIANADAIDPNDFRISLGQALGEPNNSSFYMDLNHVLVYAAAGYYAEPIGGRFEFDSASQGATPEQVVLVGSIDLNPEGCFFLQYYEVLGNDDGLFLHYAAGSIPLESSSGEVLADNGAQWVRSSEAMLTLPGAGFPNLDPRVEIPCD